MSPMIPFERWAEGSDVMREFETGATRNTEDDKYDYEGFLSPAVLRRYAEYMHRHRLQADGSLRSADNWQKGIPKEVYVKSLLRHVMDVWLLHDGYTPMDPQTTGAVSIQEALTAVMFNAMGLLYEELKG